MYFTAANEDLHLLYTGIRSEGIIRFSTRSGDSSSSRSPSLLSNSGWVCPPYRYRQDDGHLIVVLDVEQVNRNTLVYCVQENWVSGRGRLAVEWVGQVSS